MKVFASVAILLATTLTAVSTASAKPRSPRLEKLALTAADTAKARDANIHPSDLVSGWKADPATPDDGSPPDCPWQDFSAYTITGQSESDFLQGPSGIFSVIAVFQDRAQALGDYRVSTGKGAASCEGAVFARAFGKTAKLLSAESTAATNIGDRATAFRFVVKVGVNTFYVDLIVFVRDRSVAGVATVNPSSSLGGRAALVGLIDERLRPKNVA